MRSPFKKINYNAASDLADFFLKQNNETQKMRLHKSVFKRSEV